MDRSKHPNQLPKFCELYALLGATMTNDINDALQISDGLEKIFSHRASFIVIGLTGRTGSGCSTVADILEAQTFDLNNLPEISNPPKSHEDRKDRIVREWLKENWKPFKKIQVSQILQLLAISSKTKKFEDFVLEISPDVDRARIESIIDPYRDRFVDAYLTLGNIKSATREDVISAYESIFSDLPKLAAEVKRELNSRGNKSYTSIFQAVGDNVRKSGDPLSDLIVPPQLLALPEFISRIIKLARLRNKLVGEDCNYFVIDALRHPFEIRYLRERISPFYAVAVTTDDLNRRARLHHNDFQKSEIIKLDEKEYPSEIKDLKKRPAGYAAFVSQDIQACLAMSDLYISNLGSPEAHDTREAANQMVRYVALMQHPGVVTPTSIERCMHAAFSAKLNSGCMSRQVGAVITDENYSIKAIGWNDVPKGQVPCLLRNSRFAISKAMDAGAYSKYEKSDEFIRELKKDKNSNLGSDCVGGRNITYCFKKVYNSIKGDRNQVHTRSLHAEENAFLQIVKYGGQGIEGGCLFTTASPCELCAKKAYQLGIRKIFFIDPYPGISNDHVLSGGESPPEVRLFNGAIGRAYYNLYEPIMAYKDELEKILVNR